jgi:hypothetical protein
MKTDARQYRRKSTFLWGLILAALIYTWWFNSHNSLSGNPIIDGTLSVIFGLYICSRPAANAIDLLFSERGPFYRFASEWSSVTWLALNILTLLTGWIVIYLGVTHLTHRGD